ncbi:MAG TPA: Ig-like domain-containing protein [Pseudonocardiaceae bacterium]|nr:Ig-like domain-containing protein [Pseudonocardiaceae bacterium]
MSRRVLGWALVVVAALIPSATAAAAAHGETAPAAAPPGPVLPVLPLVSAQVTTQPADGTADVNPTAPVGVTVRDGTIDTVALTNAAGKVVAGRVAEDRKSWTTTEPLGYDKTYTWSGTATGIDGQHRPIAGSFRTLKPARLVGGQLNVGDNATYGIAMPIALTFTSPVADKAAVQRALSVQTSVPTEGAWAWLNNSTVHWRPKNYFAPGTKVSVTAKLYGLATGDGGYGREDLTSNFTIGRAYVLRGDTRTHRLQAFADGVQVADYPASYGLDSDPGRVTRSGTHVVIRKHDVYFMNNPKYDYQNVEARWAVRISNNGEFTHAAPWSVRQQGNTNVSHGCVNLSPESAKAVFDAVLPGDPVEIVGSSQQLGSADGDYYDWTVPWEAWLAKSALPR